MVKKSTGSSKKIYETCSVEKTRHYNKDNKLGACLLQLTQDGDVRSHSPRVRTADPSGCAPTAVHCDQGEGQNQLGQSAVVIHPPAAAAAPSADFRLSPAAAAAAAAAGGGQYWSI